MRITRSIGDYDKELARARSGFPTLAARAFCRLCVDLAPHSYGRLYAEHWRF